MKSRMEMSKRNFVFGIVGRIAGMITGIVGRSIFVTTLGGEYLGLGGFFGNVFSIISLCELGIGGAVCQSLYKPLAEENEDELSAIMTFFERVNRIISLAVLVISGAVAPVLPLLANGNISTWELYGSYSLFTLHTCISYLLSPKKCLVVCDQRMYVVSAVNTIFSVLSLFVQSGVLVCTGSYIAYLAARIVMLTARDIALNRYADKKYKFLNKKIRPSSLYKQKIKRNLGAILYHRLGGTICRCTDSLLLSAYVGLTGMGKYSNYALVIGTLGSFVDSIIGSAAASVGNLGAADRGKKSEEVMRKMFFLNFFMLTVAVSVIVSCINPFIRLWLGEKMLFSQGSVWIIVACFYFSCICDPVKIFIHSYGLFGETKFIQPARAVLNLPLSVVFVKNMGLVGVFLGTLISTVTVQLFFEVKALYKYGFCNVSVKPFFTEMLGFVFVSGASAVLCSAFSLFVPVSPAGLLVRGVGSVLISFLMIICFYGKSDYWDFCKKRLRFSEKSGNSVSMVKINSEM